MDSPAPLILIFVISWLVAATNDIWPLDQVRGFIAEVNHGEDASDFPLVLPSAMSFRLVGNQLVEKMGPIIQEKQNCEIFDLKNWSCPFSDGSGGRAMNDGVMIAWPTDQTVGLTQFEYHMLKCRLAAKQNWFDGAITCVFGPYMN